jgi:aspartate racemase
MARGLERAGAELLVMPCNTAHAFLDDIRAATQLPVISIIDVTVQALVADHRKPCRSGLLATTGCVDACLYQNALDRVGISPVVPAGAARELFMDVLKRIKSGDVGLMSRTDMLRIARALMDDGAEAIIAGCTEVPLVLDQSDLDVQLINSTECLVTAAIAAARAA